MRSFSSLPGVEIKPAWHNGRYCLNLGIFNDPDSPFHITDESEDGEKAIVAIWAELLPDHTMLPHMSMDDEKFQSIAAWLEEHKFYWAWRRIFINDDGTRGPTVNKNYNKFVVFFFTDPEHLMLFKLTWGGK